jgi:hypothetical protein
MTEMERSSAPPIPADAARAADADREAVADRLRIAAGLLRPVSSREMVEAE